MNWRRGLFRLWIVGTVLFVLAVAFVGYSEIKAEFDAIALDRYIEAHNDIPLVPQFCGQARGVAGTDYSKEERYSEDPYAKPCWYELPKFRLLYPEYKDMSDKELSRKLYAENGIPIGDPPNHWATLGMWASIAFGIPLTVLVLGASLVWAFSGFAAKRS